MELLIKASQLLLSLSILVILHELGHFIPAKLFRTRVEKFYLFFDPWFSLFKFKRKDTEYGIGWLPLGGYVKISGMIDESMDKEQMKQAPQPWEFRSKPSWQRLIIMIGGVTVNVLLAMAIYSMILFVWGEKFLPMSNMKDGIMVVDSLAYELGLKNGDVIVSIDEKPVSDFRKIMPELVIGQGKTIQLIRDGEPLEIDVPSHFTKDILSKRAAIISTRFPFEVAAFSDDSNAKIAGLEEGDRLLAVNEAAVTYFDEVKEALQRHKGQEVKLKIKRGDEVAELPVMVSAEGTIGVYTKGFSLLDLEKEGFIKLEAVNYNLIESVPAGIHKANTTLSSYIKSFKLLFTPETEGYKHIGGFLTIGSLFTPKWDWQNFWEMTAFLSIILAFINILPIPALDGGHVLFLTYEMIFSRKPNEKFLEYAQMAGMFFLLGLLIYANGNDILRLIFN